MKYFLSKWDDFAKAIRGKHILLLFDFDGTLTPIVATPKEVKLSPDVKKYLKKLAKNKRITLGIISGRSLKDIKRLVGIKGIYYSGNHGLEVKGPGGFFIKPSLKKHSPYIKRIAKILGKKVRKIKGAILEYKRLSLSLHYRLVALKDMPRLRSIFKEVSTPYIRARKVKMAMGKKIFEIRPPVLWDKGKGVLKIEEMAGKKNPVKIFIGDDLTDEDAFRVLGKNDFSIRVIRKKTSKAKYFLKNPNEVKKMLLKMTKIMALFFVILSASFTFSSYAFTEEVLEIRKMPEETATSEVLPVKKIPKVRTKVYTAKTSDGWEISINRYTLKEKNYGEFKAAVILCHGFNMNNTFWDIDKRSSLARFLARAGYDVWTPSLRGSGLSSKPMLSRLRGIAKFELENIPHMLIKTPFDITKFSWTIDDHIHKDVPTIVDFVKKKSGFDKVYWAGHSMGSIIMHAYLETESQDDIAGFISMAAMMVIPDPLNEHLKTVAEQKPLLQASLLINSTVASQLRNATFGTVKHPIEELLFMGENMHDDVLFKFFRTCIDDTSAGVVSQFSDSIRSGKMLSVDRKYDYTGHMFCIEVPMLIVAGSRDGFVTEKVMKKSYDKVSSKDKNIIIFSKENGYSTDYGHCDLIIGKNSEQEVYPPILEWLDKRSIASH